MNFVWPQLLWLLVIVPFLVVLYWWLLRRKVKGAVRYSQLAMVRTAAGAQRKWKRHVPPFLMLCALSLLLFAASRPLAVVVLPVRCAPLTCCPTAWWPHKMRPRPS
jgi:Ca-activated chloride channel family protein